MPDPYMNSMLDGLDGSPSLYAGLETGPAFTLPSMGGILQNIIKETARDITGLARTGMGVIGSVGEMMGANMPITIGDLEGRDIKGAAMLTTLAAGGFLSGALRGIPALAKISEAGIAGRPWLGKAVTASMAEAAAGMGFGLVRSQFEEDTPALRAMLGDAATFGAFGAGFSALGSATAATLGKFVGSVKHMDRAAQIQQLALKDEVLNPVSKVEREYVGRSLTREDGASAIVIRNAAKPEEVLLIENIEGKLFTEVAGTGVDGFGTAGVEALKRGYYQEGGDLTRGTLDRLLKESGDGPMSKQLNDMLSAPLEFDVQATGQASLADYQLIRDFAKSSSDLETVKTQLVAELLTDNVSLTGEPLLAPSIKPSILAQLPITSRERALLRDTGTDTEIMRRAIKAGLVDIPNLAEGAQTRDFLYELFVNDTLPPLTAGYQYIVNRQLDAFASWVMTPMRIAKGNPVIAPLVQLADKAIVKQTHGGFTPDGMLATQHGDRAIEHVLHNLAIRTPNIHRDLKKSELVMKMWDEAGPQAFSNLTGIDTISFRSMTKAEAKEALEKVQYTMEDWVEEANKVVKKAATKASKDMGDVQIETFVHEATDILNEYLGFHKMAGFLEDGLAGYFPIFNVGEWKVSYVKLGEKIDIDGAPSLEESFQGFHGWAEAKKRARQLSEERSDITAFVTPKAVNWGRDELVLMDKKQFKVAERAHREELTTVIERVADATGMNKKDVSDIVMESGGFKDRLKEEARVVGPTARPRATMGNFKERRLGERSFMLQSGMSAHQALKLYAKLSERSLAFATFEREAAEVISRIPPGNEVLANWANDYVNRMLGRPTLIEKTVQDLATFINPNARPAVLRRYSSMVRRLMTFSRLGGPFSGLVNSTQIAINTTPVLGAKYTIKGMEVLPLAGPGWRKRWDRALEMMQKHNADPGFYVPFTRAGATGGEAAGFMNRETVAAILKDPTVGWMRKGADVLENSWLMFFNGAEKVNRVVTWWGAFSKEQAAGAGEQAAAAAATALMERTQFVYRLSNMPRFLQGPAGQVLFQFKSFLVNELEFIAGLNKKELASFAAMMGAMGGAAGLFNLPGTDLASSARKVFFDESMEEWLRLQGGKVNKPGDPWHIAARTLIYGVPGIVKADLSDYVGVGTLSDVTRGFLGPGANEAKNLSTFLKNGWADVTAYGGLTDETWNTFLMKSLPSAYRRFMLGAQMMSPEVWENAHPFFRPLVEGSMRVGAATANAVSLGGRLSPVEIGTGEYRNPYNGKLIYRADDRLRTWDVIDLAVGAPTVELQADRVAEQILTRKIEKYRRQKASFGREAAKALLAGDNAAAQQAMREALGHGIVIDARTVRYYTKALQMPAADRRRRRTPQELREELLEYFEVTGGTSQEDMLRER